MQAQNWKLRKDENGIKIYTTSVENSPFKMYKAEMILPVTVDVLEKIMRRPEAFKTWFDQCSESKKLKEISENECYLYFINNAPWPVQDRDNVTHFVYEPKPDGSLWIHATGVPDFKPKEKGMVRIPEMTGHWQFQPLENGKVKIVNQAHYDLGGNMPSWMSNMAVVDPPFNTMQNLKNLVLSGL